MSRLEKAARARELRDQGLALREIGQAMADEHGRAKPYSTSTVNAWLTDPDGSRLKARQDSYRGECVDCGAPTSGNNGPDAAPDRCHACYAKRYSARNERIFAAWNAGESADQIGAREQIPGTAVGTLVNWHRRRGAPVDRHHRPHRELWATVERMWNAGASGREIAEALGTTEGNVWQMVKTMRAAGVDVPPRYTRRTVAA